MKKIIFNLILLIFIFLIILILVLSIFGIKTNKFNKLITEKAVQTKNIDLELDLIKFKIDPKKLSLFLETENPEITYRDVSIPVKNIKVYINFFSLIKTETNIKKISLILEELDITQLKKLSKIIKPSNFKSLLNNKIKEGKLMTEIDIFLNDKGFLDNFIAKGKVNGLKIQLFNNFNFYKGRLDFFADKNDILIKNVFGELEDIKISNGDIKLNIENGIKIDSNFNSKTSLNENLTSKYEKFLKKYIPAFKIKNFDSDINNNLSIYLDDTYKLKDYNYTISGKIKKSVVELYKPFKNNFINDVIKDIYLSDLQLKTVFIPKKINLNGEGKYSLNNLDFLKINFNNDINNDLIKLKLDFDYANSLDFNLINYKKSKNSVANFSLNFSKKKKKY